jgi:pyruvate dehydrogenase E1 component alpha subunit
MDRLERLSSHFDQMSEIRAFEEAVAEGHATGAIEGLLHLSIGAEATEVGVMRCLQDRDRVYGTHRPHGQFLAAGTSSRALMAELCGKETGLCRGRAGSMHLMAEQAVMATGIVGGTLSIAVGHALQIASPNVVVVFFGDGAVQTGTFHESMNMAALWRAPVLFVCENNGWVEFSSRSEHTPVEEIVHYGALFGMANRFIDGRDVEEVYEATNSLLQTLRNGEGPALLECTVSRLRPHYEGDLRKVEDAVDPLDLLARRLIDLGASADDLSQKRETDLRQMRQLRDSILHEDPDAYATNDEALVYAMPL